MAAPTVLNICVFVGQVGGQDMKKGYATRGVPYLFISAGKALPLPTPLPAYQKKRIILILFYYFSIKFSLHRLCSVNYKVY